MKPKHVVYAVITVLFLWSIWAFSPLIICYFQLPFTQEIMGQWGDTFGALNALASAAAFLAVIYSIFSQQNQIDENKKDFHMQRFENSFFEMLRMIREAREEARFVYSDDYIEANRKNGSRSTVNKKVRMGHEAFRCAYREMRFWTRKLEGTITKDDIAKIYAEKVHERYESTFGAYYRLIYGTLDRIRIEKNLDENQKNNLGNLVRSQFTSFEAVLAGCNGLNKFAKDFDNIIVQFRLLKYASRGIVYDSLKNFYPPEAFLGRDGDEASVNKEDHLDDD